MPMGEATAAVTDEHPVVPDPESGPDDAYWRVAVVEDHLLQRKRTEELLLAEPGLQVVHHCESLPDLLGWLDTTDRTTRPHLILLDLRVDRGPDVDPSAVAGLVDAGIRVLVFSALASPPQVQAVLRAGASGVLGKQDSEKDILAAVWAVLGDGQWITPELAGIIADDTSRPQLSDQEERALVLYASGLTLSSVAEALGVRPDTAKKYLARVKDKYTAAGRSIHNKADITRIAISDGYLELNR